MLVATARPGVAVEDAGAGPARAPGPGRRGAPRSGRPRAGPQPHADRLLQRPSRSWTTGPTSSPSSPPISTIPAGVAREADHYLEIDAAGPHGLRGAAGAPSPSGWWSPSCRGRRADRSWLDRHPGSTAPPRRRPARSARSASRPSCAPGCRTASPCLAARLPGVPLVSLELVAPGGGQYDPRRPGGARRPDRRPHRRGHGPPLGPGDRRHRRAAGRLRHHRRGLGRGLPRHRAPRRLPRRRPRSARRDRSPRPPSPRPRSSACASSGCTEILRRRQDPSALADDRFAREVYRGTVYAHPPDRRGGEPGAARPGRPAGLLPRPLRARRLGPRSPWATSIRRTCCARSRPPSRLRARGRGPAGSPAARDPARPARRGSPSTSWTGPAPPRPSCAWATWASRAPIPTTSP